MKGGFHPYDANAHSEGITPMKLTMDSSQIHKYASTGNLLVYNSETNLSNIRVPINLAATHDAVVGQNKEQDLMNNQMTLKDVKKYNPFIMKKKSYKIRKTPVEIRKKRHFDAFIKGINVFYKI